MASIKARGDCPCVRCLIQKKNLNQTGTSEDMAFRKAHPRVDSQARRDSVMKAKNAIQRGLAVGGDKVTCFLSNSDVPVVVSHSS